MAENTIRLNVDTAGGAKEFEKLTKEMEKAQKSSKLLDKATQNLNKGFHTSIGQISKFTAALGVSTLSITSLIHTAHDLNQKMLDWRRSFNMLSDATGDSSAAIKTWTSAWGQSLGSLEEVRSAMMSLNAGGLTVASKNFQELTVFVSNFSAASGISADTIGNLMGNMQRYWNVGMHASKSIISAGAAAQKAFDLTTGQVDELLKSIGQAQEKLGAFFNDGAESSKALAKGISVATGALTKMGVSAQTAKSFLDNMIDPENWDKSAVMMRKLGITIEDQINMMESAAGKNNFFDKLLTNLPTLAREIQSIQNPFARMQYARNLGMSNEMAMKMAKATEGDMQQILEQYKQVAKEDEAAKEKQKNAAASSAKFGEQLEFLKMQVFMPMMQWVQKMYPYFWKLMQALANHLSTAMEGATGVFSGMFKAIKPLYDWITAKEQDMKGFSGALSKTLENVGGFLGDSVKKLWEWLKEPIGNFISGVILGIPKMLINGIWQFIKSAPWWAKIIVLSVVFTKVVQAFQAFHASVNEFQTAVRSLPGKFGTNTSNVGPVQPGRLGRAGAWAANNSGAIMGVAGGGMAAAGMIGDSYSKASTNNINEAAENRSMSVGGTLSSVGAGAATGAMIGSAIPVVGTAIGALVGGAAGLAKAFIDRELSEIKYNQLIKELADKRAKVELDDINKLTDAGKNLWEQSEKIKQDIESQGKITEATVKDLTGGFSDAKMTTQGVEREGKFRLDAQAFAKNIADTGNKGGLGRRDTFQEQANKMSNDDKNKLQENLAIQGVEGKTLEDQLKNLEEQRRIKLAEYADEISAAEKHTKDMAAINEKNAEAELKAREKVLKGNATAEERLEWEKLVNLRKIGEQNVKNALSNETEIRNNAEMFGAQKVGLFVGQLDAMGKSITDFFKSDKTKAKESAEKYTQDAQKILDEKIDLGNKQQVQRALINVTAIDQMVTQGQEAFSGQLNKQVQDKDKEIEAYRDKLLKAMKDLNDTDKKILGHGANVDKKTPEIKTQNAPDFFSSFVKGYGLLDTNMLIGAGGK